MGSDRRVHCRQCGKHEREVGPVSWRGNCDACWESLLRENIGQMRARSGPNFDRWRRSMAACVGGTLLDDSQAGV